MTVTTLGTGLLRSRAEVDLRRELKTQIAQLERELIQANAVLHRPLSASDTASTPRLLSTGELEAVRDDLITDVLVARADLAALSRKKIRHGEQRVLLRRMHDDPASHRWTTVTTRDLGEPGCRQWQSRPSLGVIGLLSGWWRVRVSSGCP